MQILLNAAQAILEYQEYALQEIKKEHSTLFLDVDRGHIQIETRLIESASLKDLELSLQAIDSGIKRSIIQIKIKDDGIGIPEDIRDKIFDPFFTTRKIGEGIGLGLSVAYSIIEKHQGKIFFDSERFEGTEFIIELPLRNNLSLL
jgi:signal transduction histidine kinase